MRRYVFALVLLSASGADPILVRAVEIPKPRHLIVASVGAPTARDRKTIRAAELFYAGWNTGKAEYFQAALASTFVDNTLPSGRPQGAGGPVFASAGFRKAVPDLRCAVEEMIVAGDRVTVRQRYTGTTTGGKRVDFAAIDILQVEDGKITADWHLEDYKTLDRQSASDKRRARLSMCCNRAP